jgi:hypothetical protein
LAVGKRRSEEVKNRKVRIRYQIIQANRKPARIQNVRTGI